MQGEIPHFELEKGDYTLRFDYGINQAFPTEGVSLKEVHDAALIGLDSAILVNGGGIEFEGEVGGDKKIEDTFTYKIIEGCPTHVLEVDFDSDEELDQVLADIEGDGFFDILFYQSDGQDGLDRARIDFANNGEIVEDYEMEYNGIRFDEINKGGYDKLVEIGSGDVLLKIIDGENNDTREFRSKMELDIFGSETDRSYRVNEGRDTVLTVFSENEDKVVKIWKNVDEHGRFRGGEVKGFTNYNYDQDDPFAQSKSESSRIFDDKFNLNKGVIKQYEVVSDNENSDEKPELMELLYDIDGDDNPDITIDMHKKIAAGDNAYERRCLKYSFISEDGNQVNVEGYVSPEADEIENIINLENVEEKWDDIPFEKIVVETEGEDGANIKRSVYMHINNDGQSDPINEDSLGGFEIGNKYLIRLDKFIEYDDQNRISNIRYERSRNQEHFADEGFERENVIVNYNYKQDDQVEVSISAEADDSRWDERAEPYSLEIKYESSDVPEFDSWLENNEVIGSSPLDFEKFVETLKIDSFEGDYEYVFKDYRFNEGGNIGENPNFVIEKKYDSESGIEVMKRNNRYLPAEGIYSEVYEREGNLGTGEIISKSGKAGFIKFDDAGEPIYRFESYISNDTENNTKVIIDNDIYNEKFGRYDITSQRTINFSTGTEEYFEIEYDTNSNLQLRKVEGSIHYGDNGEEIKEEEVYKYHSENLSTTTSINEQVKTNGVTVVDKTITDDLNGTIRTRRVYEEIKEIEGENIVLRRREYYGNSNLISYEMERNFNDGDEGYTDKVETYRDSNGDITKEIIYTDYSADTGLRDKRVIREFESGDSGSQVVSKEEYKVLYPGNEVLIERTDYEYAENGVSYSEVTTFEYERVESHKISSNAVYEPSYYDSYKDGNTELVNIRFEYPSYAGAPSSINRAVLEFGDKRIEFALGYTDELPDYIYLRNDDNGDMQKWTTKPSSGIIRSLDYGSNLDDLNKKRVFETCFSSASNDNDDIDMVSHRVYSNDGAGNLIYTDDYQDTASTRFTVKGQLERIMNSEIKDPNIVSRVLEMLNHNGVIYLDEEGVDNKENDIANIGSID